MRRADVIKELEETWNVAVPQEYNVKMLKDVLKEQRNANKKRMPHLKEDVVALAKKMGLGMTGHETCAHLQRMIHEKWDQEVDEQMGSSEDEEEEEEGDRIMTIGKYKELKMTFKEILEEDKGYADWAIKTVNESEGKPHPMLKKFAKFVNQEYLKKGLKGSAKYVPKSVGCANPEEERMTIGKNKGKTFREMMEMKTDVSEWEVTETHGMTIGNYKGKTFREMNVPRRMCCRRLRMGANGKVAETHVLKSVKNVPKSVTT